MLNKKFIFGVLVLSMLPMFSAGASMSDEEGDSDLMYLKLGYQATYVGSNEMNATNTVVNTAVTPNTASLTNETYKPKYAANFLGGNLALGKYFGGDTRAEVEIAMNSDIEIDNSAKLEYFNNQIVPAAFVNKGFKMGLATINFYYDIDGGSSSTIIPYIGGGIGLGRVNFLSMPTSEVITYPVALQLKAGVQMKVNNVVPVYMGYKLVYLVEKESSDTINSFIPTSSAASTSATTTTPATSSIPTKLKASYLLHNFDVGIMIVR